MEKREDAALAVGKVMLMISDMNDENIRLRQELDASKKASSYWWERFDALRKSTERATDLEPTSAEIGGSCNE